ncbi:MAG: cytochrome C oxidase subunit II, partial [Bacteroidetes bacterium]
MVDSSMVLFGQTVAYTCYAVAIILVVAWFGYAITRPGKGNKVSKTLFYSFVSFLVVLGVSLHIVTFNTIPWVSMDLDRKNIEADQVFDIVMEDHTFILPEEEMLIQCGPKVMFNVTSNDLTYGFGLFRQDHSMLFQMQVVPGHVNDILWEFKGNGIYTIRSTEYSGPAGHQMIIKDVV